jgi:hypothetical protein
METALTRKEALELAEKLRNKYQMCTWWIGTSVELLSNGYGVILHMEHRLTYPKFPEGVYVSFEMRNKKANSKVAYLGDTFPDGARKL